MNKFAHSVMAGRELALRMFVGEQLEAVEKVAAAHGQIDESVATELNDVLDELSYREQQEKVAYNQGALNTLSEMYQVLSTGKVNRAEVLGQIKTAMATAQEVFPVPHNEKEDEKMVDYMIRGFAEKVAALNQIEVTQGLLEKCAEVVIEHLADVNG